MWSILLLASTLACSGGGTGTGRDAAVFRDGAAVDAPSATDHDGSARDAAAVDSATSGAADGPLVDQSPAEIAPDRPPAEVGTEAGADAGADLAADGSPAADGAVTCNPAPDQRGFYSSCAACPDPSDCDTIDVNGSRRYACGCSRGCPCSTHCGSYVIPGTAVSISDICVR